MTVEGLVSVGDIKATPLLFFDPEFADECAEFCRVRNIDALPALDGKSLWQRTGQPPAFGHVPMPASRITTAATPVFDLSVRDRLKQHEVLFVEHSSSLVGAIHCSDYNHPAIASYLYRLISEYERSLRALVTEFGIGEMDLIAVVDPAAGRRYGALRRSNPQAPPLHLASLVDLQRLAATRGVELNIESTRRIRNMTMHSQELVHQVDLETSDYVYDFATFDKLFDSVLTLTVELRTIDNRRHLNAGLENIGLPR